ncbi:hypothetical protein FEM48_Zijuj01G0203500 [Ziziphus jujuba var. spinosa]|uniref:Uncharacterized protein n=1 Tax=Ziziphus jujuba var. spinosa TaxID=714518 RepID=A0A978W3D0_ZIZJJ|nr:hypothetical protein FEM48_Zijuj01G0203500 [Ziziphus jujuba var. spinosa]
MEGAVGAIVELLKLIVAPLGKCVKDHRGVKEYMKTLDENLERLNCRKEDVEAKKRAELVPKTKLKKEVELWLAKTQKINEEITIIKQKVEKGNYLCRARLGSTVLEKIQEVEAHYQRGVFLDGVTDYREWRTALQELKSSMKGPNDSGNRILEQLQFSYNRLNDKKLQDCLLYCALYPEDYEIPRDELIQHLIDERIIEGMKTRQAEFEKGHSMLNKLENVCLLDGWLSEYKRTYLVKMHDLIRSMALQIASVNPGYLIEAGAGLEEIPDEEKWAEDLARVSLMSNKISCISSGVSPRCPRLSTLWLNNNILLTSIPDCFFVHMNGLSVLNLSYTDIEYLPESISELVNLTALLLKKCWRLNKLPSLANLKALRRLDFCDTKISQVPQGTEMLVNLRYLNLSTKYLEIIPGSILPKLSLQFLELQAKVKVEELATLRKLETLNWILYDINLFNSYVKLLGKRRPSNYVLMVGFNIIYDEFQYNKIVFLKNCNVNESIPEEYRLLLPEDVEFLRFEECHDVKSLREVSSLKNAIGLKACSIFNCAGIEHVLTSSCTDPLLQRLESICLFYLKNLCGLVLKERGASFLLPPQTFSSLREISVTYCPNIKKLFTLSLLVYLQNLEKLYVSRCEQMVEIIAPDEDEEEDQIQGESGGSSKFYLPKLKILKLWLLPELEILYNSRKALVVDSLQEIYIFQCLNVRRIPFLDVELHPRSLEKIYVEKEWWESLEWDHLEARNYLQPFCIWIRKCTDLLYTWYWIKKKKQLAKSVLTSFSASSLYLSRNHEKVGSTQERNDIQSAKHIQLRMQNNIRDYNSGLSWALS